MRLLGFVGRTLLGAYLVFLTMLLVYLVFGIWPTEFSDGAAANSQSEIKLLGRQATIPAEVNFILVAMIVGALGGNVHAIRSFANYAGNRRLATSWVWWYLMRPFVGLPLALIFYFGIRAGFLGAGATASDINPFGIAAVSGLVGMFSDHAAKFLRDAFENLFRVKPEKLEDALPSRPDADQP